MKKVYSILMMLAIMVIAWSLAACSSGSDDEEIGGGGGSNAAFTITIDGTPHEYNSDYLEWMSLMGTWESYSSATFLKIDVPSLSDEFRFYYPSNTNPSSYFKVGYDSFEDDATEICLYGPSKYKCTYVKGSAKVAKNDGKNLTVRFSQYTFTWNNGSRIIMFDGTLNFVLDY